MVIRSRKSQTCYRHHYCQLHLDLTCFEQECRHERCFVAQFLLAVFCSSGKIYACDLSLSPQLISSHLIATIHSKHYVFIMSYKHYVCSLYHRLIAIILHATNIFLLNCIDQWMWIVDECCRGKILSNLKDKIKQVRPSYLNFPKCPYGFQDLTWRKRREPYISL